MPESMHGLLALQAESRPDATALEDRSAGFTYAELWGKVAGMAAGLKEEGLEPGDRVAVYLDKRVETVVASFATSAAAGVLVPINPVLKTHQVAHIIEDSEARFLITSAERFALLNETEEGNRERHVVLVEEPETPVPSHSWTLHRWAELEAQSPTEASTPRDGNDAAAIFYTSGSTGKPKGVVLSQENIVVGAQSVNSYLGNSHDDCLLAALPLSFDAGFSQLTTGFAAGARVVLLNYLLPGDVVRTCTTHGVTGLTCVPPLWIQLAGQQWPEEAAEGLRYFANTGGRMPRELLGKLRETFPNAAPFLMYGLTEAFRSTYLDPAEVDRRPNSIGKAIPNAEVLVVDRDGSICQPGEEGELVHCGPLVAQGYWNDPERTAERFKTAPQTSSWKGKAVYSGDIVTADEEGFLYFVGRSDEMIKTSGYRVSPTEVEEVAYATGLVGDAVALGLENDRLGQEIVLAVSPPAEAELDQDALLKALRAELPHYMQPRRLEVKAQLPRSANGKFDREALRSALATQ